MGDFGSGHDGKSTLPYSLGKDNKFVHDVTLDSYSLSKYRVTWGQFNLWRKLTAQPLTDRYLDLSTQKEIKDWQDVKDYCLWLGQRCRLGKRLV